MEKDEKKSSNFIYKIPLSHISFCKCIFLVINHSQLIFTQGSTNEKEKWTKCFNLKYNSLPHRSSSNETAKTLII